MDTPLAHAARGLARGFAGWILVFGLLLAPFAQASPPPPPDCGNPRSAADSVFVWLRPDLHDPTHAARCLDVPPGQVGERLAVQLKQVLDARGLYVPIDDLSLDPEFRDASGRHRVVVMPDTFPVLVLERAPDGRWLYTRRTLEQVPDLYAQTFSGLSRWFQEQLPPVFYRRFLGLHLWQYLYAGILLAGAWFLGQALKWVLHDRVRHLVERAGLKLDHDTYARTNFPILALVVFGAIRWGLPDLQLPIGISSVLYSTVDIAAGLSALLAASRFVNVGATVASSWAERTPSKLDDQLVPLVRQAAQVIVLVFGVVFLADELGFDVWKLAAGVGIGGLAFALAAQDTVANLFGSVNIFVDKPFQIGDWVVIGEVEGIVEEVGFRSTRVRTFYNSVVTIPNSRITNANVDNYGMRHRRRVRYEVGLSLDTPPEKLQAFVEGARAILAAHPKVQNTYELHVYGFGPSSIQVLVYYHVVVADWHEELVTRSQNILEFVRLARELGVSFALPSTRLYVESVPGAPAAPPESLPPEQLDRIVASFGPGGERARPFGPPLKPWTPRAVEQRILEQQAGEAAGERGA